MTNSEHLKPLIVEIEAIIGEIEDTFLQLNPEQLNWKPAPKSWGVGECFEHLSTVYSLYNRQLTKIFENLAHQPLVSANQLLKTTFWGRILMNMVNPNVKRKSSAPKAFQPVSSNFDTSVLQRQIENLNQLKGYIEKAETLNLNKVKVFSPALSLIRFNLGEYLQIEVIHNRRHLEQAKSVMQQKDFPQIV